MKFKKRIWTSKGFDETTEGEVSKEEMKALQEKYLKSHPAAAPLLSDCCGSANPGKTKT